MEITYKSKTYHLDDLIEEAIKIACKHGYISYSLIQKQVHVGYARAQRIADNLVTIEIIDEPPWGGRTFPKTLVKTVSEGMKLLKNCGPKFEELNNRFC